MSNTQLYKDPLQKRNILSAQQAEQLFPSLEELILFHSTLCTDLKERVGPVQNEICKNIANVLLQRLSICSVVMDDSLCEGWEMQASS